MEAKAFKVGDVVRHRLSGERAVVVDNTAIDTPQVKYTGSLIVDYGRMATMPNSLDMKYAILVFEVIGHISDPEYDAKPVEHRPPKSDPALPRRFRWKYRSGDRGFGVYIPDGRLRGLYYIGSNGCQVGSLADTGYIVTEWVDPAPEGVK